MSSFTSNMFDALKSARAETKSSGNNAFKDILKMEKGKTYEVRLIPNLSSPKDTFFHHFTHGWESFATGQYISALSPQTFGDRDPIGEYRYKIWRDKNAAQSVKDKAEAIYRKEQWMINVYVVKDPTNPDNEGTVKILRYGKQLDQIISEAIDGVDSDQFGMRVFDFTKEGCNLRINVTDQGGYPSYTTSKFLMPSKIDTTLDDVSEQIFDLKEVYPVKSYEELQEMLDEHFFCSSDASTAAAPEDEDEDEDMPEDFKATTPPKSKESSDEDEESSDDPLDDPAVKNLLSGINSVDE